MFDVLFKIRLDVLLAIPVEHSREGGRGQHPGDWGAPIYWLNIGIE